MKSFRRTIAVPAAFTAAVAIMTLTPAGSEELKPYSEGAIRSLGVSTERIARINLVFNKLVNDGKLPGAVMLVARKGQVIFSSSLGFRDKGAGKPMTNDTIFRIYSMTKPLVSVAAMTLVEDGTMELTDPISKFLPAFKDMQVAEMTSNADGKPSYSIVPANKPITIQDLLRHTAGFAYGEITKNEPVRQAYIEAKFYTPGEAEYDHRKMTPEEQVERMAKIPLIHQPGSTFEYSMAVDILGRAVEAASGQRLSVFLQERLFKPLKMADTSFFVPAEKLERLARPLQVDPATGQENKLIDVSSEPKNDSGGAGAVSTAMDYLRFCQMLLNGGELDGVRILSPAMVRLMISDHLGPRIATPLQPGEVILGTQGFTFGLGFAVRQTYGLAAIPGAAGEFTWAGAAGTYFWVDPKDQLIAVMMTQSPGPTRPYYRRLFQTLVYQALEN